jgi:hypothetical protein
MRKPFVLIKLLKQNISVIQLVGYALSALTGISIILAGFCFSKDIHPLFSSEKGIFGKEYLVVNKKVQVTSVFGKNATTFLPEEIDEIKEQSFVRSVAHFTPSRFRILAYFELAGGLSTDLFFESVPDRYLDHRDSNWKWDEQSRLIPVIISQDYINLYNFGFAGTQGLPQISESIIQQLTFHLRLTGNDRQEVFDGRIVGFSNDLNTILVPESFMEWANKQFGTEEDANKISRLIVEVKNPADPAITQFFSTTANYVINDNKGETGKLSYFLTLLIIAILVVGGLVLLPSIGLMLLSINLIIYKNEKTLVHLLLLGYKRSSLSWPYCLLVLALNLAVGILGLWIVRFIQSLYIPRLQMLGINDFSSGFWITAVFALVFMTGISLFDMFWIKRKISSVK